MVKFIVGAVIMIVSMYFFIVDGPGMVESLMKLSPLDDRYEMELLTEFDRISRAIVLAMILSAIVQGLTAGIGYYFAGMSSLLLLTLLSVLAGLIPFVGPGVIWIPVCIYLSVYLGEPTKAVILALWGVLAVGSVDNVVKAYVLHGQSQLHPLLALLSVLGGVSSLGPIGIVVGPIVVVLLQTLLVILRRELVHLDATESLASAGAPVSVSPSSQDVSESSPAPVPVPLPRSAVESPPQTSHGSPQDAPGPAGDVTASPPNAIV
jgi:predicted PurR-regulated permease PerM